MATLSRPLCSRILPVSTAALMALLILAATPGIAAPDVVVLVRHAEKTAAPDDPGLTDAGKQRAEKLAGIFRDSGVTAIFTSEFRRTKETAAPLGKITGVTPVAVPGANVMQQRDRILAVPEGVVVVVGHSNTVPELIKALGIASAPSIDEAEFGKIFIIFMGGNGGPRLLSIRYP